MLKRNDYVTETHLQRRQDLHHVSDDDEEDLETQVEDYDPETEVDSGQIGSQEEMELLDAGELSARQFYAQLDNDPLSLDWNGYETDGQEEVFDFSSDEEETAMM